MPTQQQMNQAKLARLQQNVRIGGKGTARRKRKTVHKTASGDDKKIQQTLKRLGVQTIPQIEEVNMFREDGMVMHFSNPKGFFLFCFCFCFLFCFVLFPFLFLFFSFFFFSSFLFFFFSLKSECVECSKM